MQWLNEPMKWVEDGGKITVHADPGTDTWREPKEGGIRSKGHFRYQPVEGDFTAEVSISGDYKDLYDQAGIMVMLDDHTWMKCGVEFVHDVQHASVVMTREWSDWSIVALDNPPTTHIRAERKGHLLFIYYSLDKKDYRLMRKGYFADSQLLNVGIMAASPQKGFTVVFENFQLT